MEHHKVIFSSLGCLVLLITTSLLRSTGNFIPYVSFQMFSTVKSYLISEISTQNTSKYQISAKSMKVFESYKYLKFRPMRQLKYRL